MAGKESSIESALDKMAAEWANAELSILEYRDTGTFVIKLDEAVLQQLDDHIGELLLLWAQLCFIHPDLCCMADGCFPDLQHLSHGLSLL